MATLTRPGVEIAQEITAGAPTVLNPTLVPAIIGPCYQIVSPIDTEGSLNPDALVDVAAIMASSAALGELVSIEGKSISIKINGKLATVITFPPTLSNAGLDHNLIKNQINKELSGATAEFINDKLVLMTDASGSSQSLELVAVANDAYTELGLVEGQKASGQTQYQNKQYVIPYTSFPSPLASISEVVVSDESTKMYRYFGGTLQEFSEDSAINITAFAAAPTAFTVAGGGAVKTTTRGHAPALHDTKTSLFGVVSSGLKTNKLAHLGGEASVKVPLGHDIAPDASQLLGAAQWPDPRGANYIEVKAVGLSKFRSTGIAADMGTAASTGAAGNDLTVTLANGAVSVAYVAANGLTITLEDTTTFAELQAAIDACSDLADNADEIEVYLRSDVSDSSTALVRVLDFAGTGAAALGGGLIDAAGSAVWNLCGGHDPIDFTADAGSINAGAGENVEDMGKAYVCGSLDLGASTAADLGITGESITISVDGSADLSHTFEATDVPATVINTLLGANSDGAAETLGYSLANALGETFNPVRMSTSSANGHDSMLKVSMSSASALQALLSGSIEGSGSGSLAGGDITPDNANGDAVNTARAFELAGSDYNKPCGSGSPSIMQMALQPGHQKITLGAVIAVPAIRLGDISGTWAGTGAGAKDLKFTVDGGALVENSVTVGVEADLGTIVGLLNGAGALNPGVTGIEATIHNSEIVLFHNNGPVAGSSITINSGTDSDLLSIFGLANTGDDGADDLANTSTAVEVSAVLSDSGAGDFGIEVASISNGLGHVVPSAPSDLTGWCMEGETSTNTGKALSRIAYSTGAINIGFTGDSSAGSSDDAVPVALRVKAGTTWEISFKRAWASNAKAASSSYSSRSFHGTSNSTELADRLYDNGTALGLVVGRESFSTNAAAFSGAMLVLDDLTVDNKAELNAWYATAEGLDDELVATARKIQPEGKGNDLDQSYTIKGGLNTDAGGISTSGSADIYVDYSALRKDVTGAASNPGLLTFNSIAEVESSIGPIDPANPLAFGLYMAFLNTSNINVSAIGVSATTADAPMGTVKAYAEAFDFLAMKEVYALAPLTHDMEVIKLLNQHVTDMSAPSQKKERMGFGCPALPTEKPSALAVSGDWVIEHKSGTQYTATLQDSGKNLFLALSDSAISNAGGDGLDPTQAFDPADGVYFDRAGDAFRYLVVGLLDGEEDTTLILETADIYQAGVFGPATAGNEDLYFNTNAPEDITDVPEAGSVFVRQAALDNSSTGGKLETCDTLAEIAGGVTGFQNRRLVMIQPESCAVSIGGMETLVPGYYLSCGVAAMTGQQNPSQPFTNLPMVGFSRPIGSNDLFSEDAMATAAAGGIYWIIQDVVGGPCVSRHQLTTDVTSLKTREFSILKSVDYVAKLLRGQVKKFIGRNNITKQLLEAVSLGMQGSLSSVTGSVVAEASLDSLTQDAENPDTIKAEVSIVPFYPANYIKITIYV